MIINNNLFLAQGLLNFSKCWQQTIVPPEVDSSWMQCLMLIFGFTVFNISRLGEKSRAVIITLRGE